MGYCSADTGLIRRNQCAEKEIDVFKDTGGTKYWMTGSKEIQHYFFCPSIHDRLLVSVESVQFLF